jgi:hypothetical protein
LGSFVSTNFKALFCVTHSSTRYAIVFGHQAQPPQQAWDFIHAQLMESSRAGESVFVARALSRN